MQDAHERYVSKLQLREQELSRCVAELETLRNTVEGLEFAKAQAEEQFAHERSQARVKEQVLRQQAQNAQNGWQLQTEESTRLEKLNGNSERALELLQQQHQQLAFQWSEKKAQHRAEAQSSKRRHEELCCELEHANATAERYHAELAQAEQIFEEQAERGTVAQLTSELQGLRSKLLSSNQAATASRARAQHLQETLQNGEALLQEELEAALSENAASLRRCATLENEVRQISQALTQGSDAEELLEASLKEKKDFIRKLEIDIANDGNSARVATQHFESATAALKEELQQAKHNYQEESRKLQQEQLAAAQKNTNLEESRAVVSGLLAAKLELQDKLETASSELQNALALAAAEGERLKEECSEVRTYGWFVGW